MLLGVDVGGTFTDAVVFDGRELHTAKRPTTPGDEASGVMAAVEAALERAGAEAGEIARFVHGTTVGTNALLTERGARTALIATAGFEDLLEIARQDRPSLHHLCEARPVPLVAPDDRLGAVERTGPEGVVEPLRSGEAERLAAALAELGAESVAICLLFAHADETHERTIAEAIRSRLPAIHVSASHEVLPRFREYERCSTTTIDAYLAPLLGRYLRALASACEAGGLPAPDVMRSSGGVAPWEEATRGGAWSVLSGPAGGAVGASLLASLSGNGDALALDMGGTSCDVCVTQGGEVSLAESRTIGGRVVQLPTVDVQTVGAGGGSIAWLDHGGALRVGPRSAGAEPGPACYGRGGTEPTVTDANLVLGRLAPDSELAGGVALDAEAASSAIAGLSRHLGLDETATAEGIVRLANEGMLGALRVVTVERGIDPRSFALMPFGGAGPMHAAEIAEQLGISRILCPRAGGVLSALGLLASSRRRDTARTVMVNLDELDTSQIAAAVDSVRGRIAAGMDDAEISVSYELRYKGQGFELSIPGSPDADPERLRVAFEEQHQSRYGFRHDAGVELVTIAVALSHERPDVEPLAATDEQPVRAVRQVWLGGEWREAVVLRGELSAGIEVDGPAVLELPETTLVLPAGWSATVDEHGTVRAERG